MNKELTNLFADKKTVRKAFQSLAQAIATSPAADIVVTVDKDGNPTSDYQLQQYSLKSLQSDIDLLSAAQTADDEYSAGSDIGAPRPLPRDDKARADFDRARSAGRRPTEIEMILHCQMIKARWDTNAAVFIRDTMGAKPVDETKSEMTVANPYEQMTDDELEALAEYRRRRDAAADGVIAGGDTIADDTLSISDTDVGTDGCVSPTRESCDECEVNV